VLSRLERKSGAKAAFARGYHLSFSELYLRNDGGRAIHFRAGADFRPTDFKHVSLFMVYDTSSLSDLKFHPFLQ
jgi:hypothetical protein